MKTNCLNLTLVNGEILIKKKRKEEKEVDRPCVNMLQYSNGEIAIW